MHVSLLSNYKERDTDFIVRNFSHINIINFIIINVIIIEYLQEYN